MTSAHTSCPQSLFRYKGYVKLNNKTECLVLDYNKCLKLRKRWIILIQNNKKITKSFFLKRCFRLILTLYFPFINN